MRGAAMSERGAVERLRLIHEGQCLPDSWRLVNRDDLRELLDAHDAAVAHAAVLREALDNMPCACIEAEGQIAMECGRCAAAKLAPSAALEEMRETERDLRQLLWLSHGCSMLYGDDGEMQCQECRVDFKRASIDRISEALRQRGIRRYEEQKRLAQPTTGSV